MYLRVQLKGTKWHDSQKCIFRLQYNVVIMIVLKLCFSTVLHLPNKNGVLVKLNNAFITQSTTHFTWDFEFFNHRTIRQW